MKISDIIKKSQNDETFSKEELVQMLSYAPDSFESYQIMAQANRISKEITGNMAEVHGQFALNLAPCPSNCKFCSFAMSNKVFDKTIELSPEEAIQKAQQFEKENANAIYLMTTPIYPFEKFIEISKEVRRNIKPETVLIANVGDQSLEKAKKVKDTGYQAVYHALRLREGIDTGLDPEKRKISIKNFQEAGLQVGTCVEPVGPEHTNEEIAEMILFTASINPSFSGAARRITVPGSQLEPYGMISELRMAQIVAITRLGIPRSVKGNCTHEPCTLGAIAGANLFWAEVGANPRDTKEKTEEGRGTTVEYCNKLFDESGWNTLKGESVYFKEKTGTLVSGVNT